MDLKLLMKKLAPIKYPLLILAFGLLLLLMPSGKKQAPGVEGDAQLAQLLASAEGVGQTQLLVSEHGVVIVCEGAENAAVKLDIIRAIGSYTGFGADKITILHLTDQ
ncbi:MAG: hypothetical protein IKI69_03765 [Oscillospiraceae bacterium]|nr:hypothetical protein [Oscillospiraceae bacterium]